MYRCSYGQADGKTAEQFYAKGHHCPCGGPDGEVCCKKECRQRMNSDSKKKFYMPNIWISIIQHINFLTPLSKDDDSTDNLFANSISSRLNAVHYGEITVCSTAC